jgi:rod shape-determining protein MreB
VLTSEGRSMTFHSTEPFTTTRLLIGKFFVAESCLTNAVKEFGAIGFFKRSPKITIQPHEFLEGGLSEVEDRVLREIAMGAGAREVHVVV